MGVFIDKYKLGEVFRFIHPFKQQAVKHIVDNIWDEVTHVIIFGSSTDYSCRYDSDIDVCLIGKDIEAHGWADLMLPGQKYDFLTYPNINDLERKSHMGEFNVEKHILNGGIYVYAKQ